MYSIICNSIDIGQKTSFWIKYLAIFCVDDKKENDLFIQRCES